MKKALVIATLAALSAASSQAATVFSDDFEGNAYGLNVAPSGWTVTNGTVDIIGPLFFNLCGAGNGKCIDLDGSSSDAGILSKSLNLTAGVQYTASFDLAGNQRGGSTDTGTVAFGFGGTNLNYSLTSAQAFSTYQLVFTPSTSGVYTLSFANAGGDNVGALLDNVAVINELSAVPEPETFAMLLAGLGLMGAVVRRKSKAA